MYTYILIKEKFTSSTRLKFLIYIIYFTVFVLQNIFLLYIFHKFQYVNNNILVFFCYTYFCCCCKVISQLHKITSFIARFYDFILPHRQMQTFNIYSRVIFFSVDINNIFLNCCYNNKLLILRYFAFVGILLTFF